MLRNKSGSGGAAHHQSRAQDDVPPRHLGLLLEEMEQPEVAWRHVILRTRLVVRGSA